MTTKARVDSALYIVFGSVLILLGFAGHIYEISILPYSLLIALLGFLLTVRKQNPYFVRLIDVWILSYLYLFFSEYRLQNDDVWLFFGNKIASATEGFVVASFGASLVGYGIIAHLASRRQEPRQARSYGRVSALTIGSEASVNSQQDECNPPKNTTMETPPIPAAVVGFMFLLSLAIGYFIFEVLTIPQLLFVARSQHVYELPVSQLVIFLFAAIVTFPVVTAYLWGRFRIAPAIKFFLLLMSFLVVVVIFLLGTRIYLGFQMMGILFFLLRGFRVTKRQILTVAMVVVLLIGAQAIMRVSRSTGIGDLDWQKARVLFLQQPEIYLSAEGVLRINAWIHSTKSYAPEDRLPENLFIAIWWIPRQVWPEKPTMAGYWFIRESTGETGFSQSHSASGGFSMPALLDFGPTAGVLFCLTYGFLLAGLEMFVQRNRDRIKPQSVLAGLLFFGVFFMMRSLQTSLIFMMICALVSTVPLALLVRLAESRHIDSSSWQQQRMFVRPIGPKKVNNK